MQAHIYRSSFFPSRMNKTGECVMHELYCCAKGAIKTNKNWICGLPSVTYLLFAKLNCYGVLWHALLQLVNCQKFILLETLERTPSHFRNSELCFCCIFVTCATVQLVVEAVQFYFNEVIIVRVNDVFSPINHFAKIASFADKLTFLDWVTIL